MANMIARVRSAKKVTVDELTFVSITFNEKITAYRKVGGAVVLSEDYSILLSAKRFLHSLKEANIFDAEDYSLDEAIGLVNKAVISIVTENFKEGDKYVTEEGEEKSHEHSGTNISFGNIKLSEDSISEVKRLREIDSLMKVADQYGLDKTAIFIAQMGMKK